VPLGQAFVCRSQAAGPGRHQHGTRQAGGELADRLPGLGCDDTDVAKAQALKLLA